jgi:outer membrane lipoprotein-sorting protein
MDCASCSVTPKLFEEHLDKPLMMIRPAVLVLFIMLLSPVGAGFCESQALDKMRAAAEKITSIQGDFIQEKQMPILARPLIAKGYFAYQRPASLRWEYRSPVKSVLLLHDGSVRRYLHSDKGWVEDTVTQLKSMEFILREISNWLNGRFTDNPMFHAAVEADRKIVMTPKDKGMDQFIRRIELVMADRPGLIKSVTIYENSDSFTRFTFTDPRINAAIGATQFRKVQ